MILYVHEMKMNMKNLIIWTLCVGGMCFGCILLYSSFEDSLQGMADAYSNMGAMSQAMGMDKMSIATLVGFYATEIALMHGLGGAMFAAITGTCIISKEEMMHTSDFLNAFPIKRSKIIMQKYLALVTNVIIFNVVCVILYVIGIVCLGEDIMWKEMLIFHGLQILMQIEVGTICFMISAFSKKNLIGAGLGVTILLFAMDMMCRIIPAIKNFKYITPFYYSNASDIFSGEKVDAVKVIIGVIVLAGTLIAAWYKYSKKDLAS